MDSGVNAGTNPKDEGQDRGDQNQFKRGRKPVGNEFDHPN